MRAIEFRAWNKTLGKWDYFTLANIATYLQTLQLHLLNGDVFYQYTGLKDKNGKTIYEGDILKWQMTQPEYAEGWCWVYGVVEFGQGSFRYSMVADGHEWLNLPMVDSNCVLMGGVESHEIIGNIYSNPELIEGGTK